MVLLFAVPILMSFLSLILKDGSIRWVNRGIGTFFALFDLVFLGMTLFLWPFSAYGTLWSVVYLVFTALIVYYSWKWPEREA